MSRIETSKLAGHVYVAPPAGTVALPKLVMHVWAMPGDDGSSAPASTGQGQVYGQIVRNVD
jgi:hypothetical protein